MKCLMIDVYQTDNGAAEHECTNEATHYVEHDVPACDRHAARVREEDDEIPVEPMEPKR